MIKSISVENYRGFKQKATLDFRPLTILLGRNSSGKSSLTRLIPLLQQSLGRQSSSPILWSSEAVDLGNISDVITHESEDKELRIGIKISAPRFLRFLNRNRYEPIVHRDKLNAEIEYIIRLSADGFRTKFDGIEIAFDDQILSVDWNSSGIVESFSVNGECYPLNGAVYSVETKSLFPDISRSIIKAEIEKSTRTPIFYDPIRKALESVIHGRTASDKIDYFARRFSFIPKADARETLKSFPNVVPKKITDANARYLSDLSMINDLPAIMRYLEISISPIFLSSAYIGPSRASGKRFDRIQELAVNRLDSSGENTAMYIYSLNSEERSSFNDLLIRACGHVLDVEDSGPGHVSIKIGRHGQTQFENIADVGFGFSQLVPVVAQLHAVRERNVNFEAVDSDEVIFAVEQPELHLHPAMQSSLADLFVGAVKTETTASRTTRILVETHSETLIAQLGVLIAEEQISPEEVAVYFVSKDESTGESSLKEMQFDSSGVITDWPVGFFSAL